MLRSSVFFLSGCALLCLAHRSLAQTTANEPDFTRHEISFGISSQPTAPTLRYTFNLSPSLAVETRLTGLPPQVNFNNGSDTLQLVAGIKAGVRRHHWDFAGILEPGWSLVSDTDIQFGIVPIGGQPVIAPIVDRPIQRSRFVLNTGADVEYSFTPRTFVRLDVLDTVEPTINRYEFVSSFLAIDKPGAVRNYGSLTLTAGHRFGRLLHEPDPVTRPPHLEAGLLFAQYDRTNLLFQDLNIDPGIGGWVSASVAPHLDIEGAAFHFGQDDRTGNIQDGGKQLLASGGIKTGFRKDRLGIFLKVRGGGVRFSRTYANDVFASYQDYFNDPGHYTWQPTLDLGGVVEVYPVRHIVFRAEAGPTLIFYRSASFSVAGQSGTIASSQASSLLLLFGGGFRF